MPISQVPGATPALGLLDQQIVDMMGQRGERKPPENVYSYFLFDRWRNQGPRRSDLTKATQLTVAEPMVGFRVLPQYNHMHPVSLVPFRVAFEHKRRTLAATELYPFVPGGWILDREQKSSLN